MERFLHINNFFSDLPDVIKSKEVCPYILDTLMISSVVEQVDEKKES